MLIGAFLVVVLALFGGDVAATDQPISPGLFSLLALGFIVFANTGLAFLDQLSSRE